VDRRQIRIERNKTHQSERLNGGAKKSAHKEPITDGKIQCGTEAPKQKSAGKTRSARAEDPTKGKTKIDCQTGTRPVADLNPAKGNMKLR
jgi:hypothetical protein